MTLAASALAGNSAREAALASVLRTLEPEQAVTISVGAQSVFALLVPENSGDPQGGVILLHDLDAHPDWSGVIRPLRLALADAGWTTLSVQMPLSSGGNDPNRAPLVAEARPRIEAAVKYLLGKKIQNIVLIGHGLGAVMAANYLRGYTGNQVRGLVVIGMIDPPQPANLRAAVLLKSIRIPVLDIYGSRDLKSVTGSADDRAAAVRTANGPAHASGKSQAVYRQVVIPGADHAFTGEQDNLFARIRGWLNRYIGHPPVRHSMETATNSP